MNAEQYLALTREEKLTEVDKRLIAIDDLLNQLSGKLEKDARKLREMLILTKSEVDELEQCNQLDRIALAQMARLTFQFVDQFILDMNS